MSIAEFSRRIKHNAISYGFSWLFLKLFNHWAQPIMETQTGAFPTGALSHREKHSRKHWHLGLSPAS